MNRNTRVLLAALALLVFGAIGFLLWESHQKASRPVAQIYRSGVLLREVALDAVTQPEEFIIEGENGAHNTVLIEPGRICISDASCPDQLCIHQGWISDRSIPLVCLPNQVMIQIVGGGEGVDAVTG